MESFDELRRLIRQFENRHCQGYVAVTFASSAFTWGTIRYRRAMSGAADGEMCFISIAHAEEFIRELLEG